MDVCVVCKGSPRLLGTFLFFLDCTVVASCVSPWEMVIFSPA